MGADDDDLDRTAILARRQRFIALALSGLASAGACTPTDPPKEEAPRARPGACLSIEPRQPEPNAPKEPIPPPPDATPVPCLAVPLDFVPPPPDTGKPTACLSVAPDERDSAGAAPCLSIAPKPTPPKPPTPVPCLEIKRDGDG